MQTRSSHTCIICDNKLVMGLAAMGNGRHYLFTRIVVCLVIKITREVCN